MDTIRRREGDRLTIHLSGELNSATASELEEVLAGEVKPGDTVVFEMADLIYITSSGLRVLIACDAKVGEQGSVILHGVRDEIRMVLVATGFDSILIIE